MDPHPLKSPPPRESAADLRNAGSRMLGEPLGYCWQYCVNVDVLGESVKPFRNDTENSQSDPKTFWVFCASFGRKLKLRTVFLTLHQAAFTWCILLLYKKTNVSSNATVPPDIFKFFSLVTYGSNLMFCFFGWGGGGSKERSM